MLLSVLILGNLRALERHGTNFHSLAEKWGAGKKFRMPQTGVPEGNCRQCRRKAVKVISIPALCLFPLDKEWVWGWFLFLSVAKDPADTAIHQIPIRAGNASSLSLLQSHFCLGRVSVTHTGTCSFKYSSTISAWWVEFFPSVSILDPRVPGLLTWGWWRGRRAEFVLKAKSVSGIREQLSLGCDFWFSAGGCTSTDHWAALSCGCFPFWHTKML